MAKKNKTKEKQHRYKDGVKSKKLVRRGVCMYLSGCIHTHTYTYICIHTHIEQLKGIHCNLIAVCRGVFQEGGERCIFGVRLHSGWAE